VGKSHLQNIEIKPAQYPKPGTPRLAHEARRESPGRHGQEIWKRWEDDPTCDIETPFYGFDHVDLCIHHADDEYGHWRRWARQQDPNVDALIGHNNALATPEFELSRCQQAWRTQLPEHLYPTHWIAERTMNRIEQAQQKDAPFFLHCSFPDPHHPFTPPGKYWDMYQPEEVQLPPSFHAPHTGLAPHIKALYKQRDEQTAVKNTQALFACTEREAREAIALNYGSISMIDDAIGRVLSKLKDLGLADNTVIVFTADHGDFLGDHQLLLKGPIHYRGLTRVPLIWADTHAASIPRTSALCQTVDLAPTILERAGVAPWNGIQGQSLLPILSGKVKEIRQDLLIEEEGQRYYMGFNERVRMRSLIYGAHRISVYDGVEWGELYDRGTDPEELNNLWDVPAHQSLRATMTERMLRHMIALAETSPYPTQIA
jgi:arylsulfatase A-like enzyme